MTKHWRFQADLMRCIASDISRLGHINSAFLSEERESFHEHGEYGPVDRTRAELCWEGPED